MAARAYAAPTNEPYKVDAVDVADIDPKYLRQVVDFPTREPVGTIVVDPHERFRLPGARTWESVALRCRRRESGSGIHRDRDGRVQKEMAALTPTSDMIKREPARYKPWQKGMDGGARNPLGARALYLFKNGKDTLFRIHGTTEPSSIGKAVSSGCIRMVNQDIIDLYSRVPDGSKVVVR